MLTLQTSQIMSYQTHWWVKLLIHWILPNKYRIRTTQTRLGSFFSKCLENVFCLELSMRGCRNKSHVIDEAVDCGKGSNVVISYLHHYLSCHSVGESDLSLQADNCAGQNKNNYMLVYLIWRVLKGYHRRVNYNFMIAGHTKFTPDRCFGLIKKKYRSLFCSSVFDVAAAINESSTINQAEI